MCVDDSEQQNEPALQAMPTLSVGFWDAFASGSMWPGPVLAVVSFSAVGKDHILYVQNYSLPG